MAKIFRSVLFQVPNSTETLLPVMVWIYGGGFMMGNSEYEDAAPDYFLDNDIVFVSITYRIGILGFLSLNDLVAPGNNGLKDQNLALRWVKENIKYFGGDPEQVTIFGQSAGSASVSYHLQSPLSAGEMLYICINILRFKFPIINQISNI